MGAHKKRWSRYDPSPPAVYDRKKLRRIRLVGRKKKKKPYDGLSDYIEDAAWWIARSKLSVSRIQRAFDRGDVPGVLVENTGAILELGHTGKQYVIAIQLVRDFKEHRNWDVDLTLQELGIYVDELWDGESDVDIQKHAVP